MLKPLKYVLFMLYKYHQVGKTADRPMSAAVLP